MALWIALTSVMNAYVLEASQACANWCKPVWTFISNCKEMFTAVFTSLFVTLGARPNIAFCIWKSAKKVAKFDLWFSGKCVCFGVGRSRDRLSAGSYKDLVNWNCSLLTSRTMYGRASGNTTRKQNKPSENEPRNCTNSVLALQDLCSYQASTTNHHIKQSQIWQNW